jgi:hypothetical protein
MFTKGLFPLNIDMVRAGVAAFERWNLETEPPECMVTDVFYSMIEKARDYQSSPNSPCTASSNSRKSGD